MTESANLAYLSLLESPNVSREDLPQDVHEKKVGEFKEVGRVLSSFRTMSVKGLISEVEKDQIDTVNEWSMDSPNIVVVLRPGHDEGQADGPAGGGQGARAAPGRAQEDVVDELEDPAAHLTIDRVRKGGALEDPPGDPGELFVVGGGLLAARPGRPEGPPEGVQDRVCLPGY